MKPTRSNFWRWLLYAVFWGPDVFTRVVFWACILNAILFCTPLRNSPWLTLLPMSIIAASGVGLIRARREAHHNKKVFGVYKPQAEHWLRVMEACIKEKQAAEERHANASELEEIDARFQEAVKRFEREHAIFSKSIQ